MFGHTPAPPATSARTCTICGSPVTEDGEACERRAHYRGTSRIPLHSAKKYGPSPGALRVRTLSSAGLRFVAKGQEYDAERCPERPETDVWIVCPVGESEGVSYRLNAGEWEPVVAPAPKRKARSLDDL